ncbi:MAG TPA: hypothetical protein V6D12_03560 [Candidatus Obscuribacterales bacterium]
MKSEYRKQLRKSSDVAEPFSSLHDLRGFRRVSGWSWDNSKSDRLGISQLTQI